MTEKDMEIQELRRKLNAYAGTGINKIPYEERKRIYELAIERWGIEPQLLMVLEEMIELQKEICKYFRGKNNLDAIAEETADVTIMLEQLRLIFKNNRDVCEVMDRKVERLAERLGAEVLSDGSTRAGITPGSSFVACQQAYDHILPNNSCGSTPR